MAGRGYKFPIKRKIFKNSITRSNVLFATVLLQMLPAFIMLMSGLLLADLVDVVPRYYRPLLGVIAGIQVWVGTMNFMLAVMALFGWTAMIPTVVNNK